MQNNANKQKMPEEKYWLFQYKRLIFNRRSIPAWICLFIGLCFTFLSTFSLHEQHEISGQKQFKLHVEQLVKAIHKRLQDHELILLGAAALMDVNDSISRQQWHDYVARLSLAERYPGIQGVGYSEIFPARALSTHIASMQAEGFPDYSIKPVGEREIYSGIIYLEPFSGRNLAAFGYDMFSDPIRREAMQRAIEENKTTISGKVRLVQETHGKAQAGFLMYVPIYRSGYVLNTLDERWQAIQGFVYSPYRMNDLMEGIFNREQMLVNFQLFDGKTSDPADLMYDSSLSPEKDGPNFYQEQEDLPAFGRTWRIKVTGDEGFEAQFENNLDWMVPTLGSAVSFSIFIMTLVLLGRRESAQQLAAVMIEQSKHAREHFHQQLSDVLSAASEVAIIAADKQGIITIFNTGAERLLGYQGEELIGKSSPAIFHDPEQVKARSEELTEQLGIPIEGFRTFVEMPDRNGYEKREWTYLHKLGYPLTVSLVVTPVRDSLTDEITGYLGIAEDITERKRVEHLKSEFVSTVSHELRTPLTAISGALKLIASGIIGPINDKTKELLTIAVNNSERLAHLVNDLLDFERIVGGQLQFDFQVQPLKPLIERALESHQTYSVKEHVKLTLAGQIPDLELNVDAHRFMQVLANLISNAIKFSPSEGRVLLTVAQKQDVVRITVSDEGPGISAEFESRIFERFAQADSSDTRQKGGTGLGLAISKELIEGMHGKIGFFNNPDQGASFWVELPLK